MKKYFPIILLLATFTLSACGANKTADDNKNKSEENPKTESAKSLKELLGLGTSQKCTYETNDNGDMMKGEIITKGQKFKQTTEITNKEGTMKVYAISDGTYYYSWSDAMKGNGTKMKIADLEKDSASVTGTVNNDNKAEQKSVNLNEKLAYKCTGATLNDSDLNLPTDVKFVDYTEMMKGLQNGNLEDLKKLIPSKEE